MALYLCKCVSVMMVLARDRLDLFITPRDSDSRGLEYPVVGSQTCEHYSLSIGHCVVFTDAKSQYLTTTRDVNGQRLGVDIIIVLWVDCPTYEYVLLYYVLIKEDGI